MLKSRQAEPADSPLNRFQVGPGTVVSVSYELYDADGDLVEASLGGETLVFIHGYGQAAPALERALEGMAAGDARRVRLAPEEAFGRRDRSAIIEVARDELPAEIAVGDEFSAESEASAAPVCLTVLEVGLKTVLLDANHPLAGQTVELDVVIEDVRPATTAELDEAAALLQDSPNPVAGTLIPTRGLLKREAPPAAKNGRTADAAPSTED